MAGPETIHKITEKIMVEGSKSAQREFNQLGVAADSAAERLGHTEKSAEQLSFGFAKTEEVTKDVGATADKAGEKMSLLGKLGETGLRKMVTGMTLAGPAIGVLDATIGFVVTKLSEFIARGWEASRVFEAMQGRVQGLVLGLSEWGDLEGPERINQSLRITNTILEQQRDIAVRAAIAPAEIEAAYTRINSVLSGTGRTQADILKVTEQTAAAAKVYGDNAEIAGGIVTKAIFEGVVEGETAFAKALKAQAQVTSKMKLEDRMARVVSVLQAMGEPLATVTTDTESMLLRWQILSDDVLQRMTFPAYQKIGEIVGRIVAWTEENENSVNAVVKEVQEWAHAAFDVAGGIWDVVAGTVQILDKVYGIRQQVDLWWDKVKLVRQGFSLIGTGLQLMVQWFRVLTGDEAGFGKAVALSTAVELKWYEIAKQVVKVVKSIADMAVPDFIIDRVPAIKGFFEGMDRISRGIDDEIADTAKRLRKMEENLGIKPLTDTTREILERESKASVEELKKARGRKLQLRQNIAKVEIRQDFRDADPDRVLVEFVGALERLGEEAVQSTADAELTAFEAGGTT